MANFQKTAGDHSTRLDTVENKLVLMLEERVKIDLWGGGPNGEELVVDADDQSVVSVSSTPVKQGGGALVTYEVRGMKSGKTTLAARLFNQTPANDFARRQLWSTMPVWAKVEVNVLGAEYRQGGGTWGRLTYGSTKPAWAKVHWTNMAQAGCGPTSLAMVMDYVIRLHTADSPTSFVGTDPKETMNYTATYGRTADAAGNPVGTSGPVMIANIGKHWPGYEGKRVTGVGEAATLLRAGTPLIFLAQNTTTYKYDAKGNKVYHKWPGHFMVLLGVEHDNKTFWISDPSRAQHKYISSDELKKCQMWQVYRT